MTTGRAAESHLELEGTDPGFCYVIVCNYSDRQSEANKAKHDVLKAKNDVKQAKNDVLKAFIEKIRGKGIKVKFAISNENPKRHYLLLEADEERVGVVGKWENNSARIEVAMRRRVTSGL